MQEISILELFVTHAQGYYRDSVKGWGRRGLIPHVPLTVCFPHLPWNFPTVKFFAWGSMPWPPWFKFVTISYHLLPLTKTLGKVHVISFVVIIIVVVVAVGTIITCSGNLGTWVSCNHNRSVKFGFQYASNWLARSCWPLCGQNHRLTYM